jgi:hypothetical protein
MIAAPPLPTLWTRLPAGGWQVGFWIDDSGRTLIDVADPLGTLTYRMAGASQAAPSIDVGWSGSGYGPGGEVCSWALALGRLPAEESCTVTFVSPGGPQTPALLPDGMLGRQARKNGLWVATAIGSYSHVRLILGSGTRQYPLLPIGW